ncbi:MAG: hypothetical protein ABI744_03025 [Chloroflexota bacterium]
MPEISPAPVLSVLVGLFHTGIYLLIRGSGGLRLAFVGLAAMLGAYAGQALGARLGDPLAIGDFGLLYASALAWVGILIIVAASVIASARTDR